VAASRGQPALSAPTFEVFFDGDCPLCVREIAMLRRMDRHARVRFTDIAAPDFDTEGLPPWDVLMDRIHGRRLDTGELVEGVEVFRALYEAVGFGWVVAWTRVRPLDRLLDRAYRAFASRRLRLTGRCDDRGCAVRPRVGPARTASMEPATR
jgi:predicted DCC family thiol-disulfide oxidoreductase YuxK